MSTLYQHIFSVDSHVTLGFFFKILEIYVILLVSAHQTLKGMKTMAQSMLTSLDYSRILTYQISLYHILLSSSVLI